MGPMNEHWDFWHISNISRNFERDRARAFWCMITYLSFQKSLNITSQARKKTQTAKERICNPFVNKPNELTLSVQEEYQLFDDGLKCMFETTSNPQTFGLKSRQNNLRLPQKHWKSLLLFPKSYLWEAGFSAVTATKTKLWSWLDLSNTLWVSVSPNTPRLGRLVEENKFRAPTDSALWWVVELFHYIL